MAVKLNPKIEIKKSPIEGKGLFAKAAFKEGEHFTVTAEKLEHPSVIMSDKEFEEFKKTAKSWDAVYIGDGKHRVGTLPREDDPSNFGNHSCDPNTAPAEDGLVALREIRPGDELTIDYAQFSPKSWSMKCNCGSKNCKHIIHGKL